VLACFAERAVTLDCVRPELVDDPQLLIEAGRHPVVERASREPFVPNDLRFDDERRMLIITGPNMGGKSTYMRQTALIVILAHIGCFVPAKRAVMGPLDRIFTRIGASDDLAGGRSTFMLEMTETANILHNATEPQSRAHGRGRARHEHLRRIVARLGLRGVHRERDPRLHAVRDPLFRTHEPRLRISRASPTCTSRRSSTASGWCSCTASRGAREPELRLAGRGARRTLPEIGALRTTREALPLFAQLLPAAALRKRPRCDLDPDWKR
jgi:hypothetical protein